VCCRAREPSLDEPARTGARRGTGDGRDQEDGVSSRRVLCCEALRLAKPARAGYPSVAVVPWIS
jgi:hypothetical protein